MKFTFVVQKWQLLRIIELLLHVFLFCLTAIVSIRKGEIMQTHSTLINLTAFFYLMKRKDSFFHMFYSASGKASKSNKPNLYFMDIEIRIQHQRRSPVYFYESCSVAHEAQKIDFPGVKSAGAGWGAKFGFSPPSVWEIKHSSTLSYC